MSNRPPLSTARIRAAWVIALAVDAIQIPAAAAGPAGWFLDAGLDLITMAVLWALLGFHWAFLPSFITEGVPYLNLAPVWTLAVAMATRGRVANPRRRPGTRPADGGSAPP